MKSYCENINSRKRFLVLNKSFENVLICIISIKPSGTFRPISNFPNFCQNKNSLELLNLIFEKSSPKGSFGAKKKKFKFSLLSPDSSKLLTTALKTLCVTIHVKTALLFCFHMFASFSIPQIATNLWDLLMAASLTLKLQLVLFIRTTIYCTVLPERDLTRVEATERSPNRRLHFSK